MTFRVILLATGEQVGQWFVPEAGRDLLSSMDSGSWSSCLSRGWTAVRLAV